MSMLYVGVGTTLLGAYTSYSGAKKQSKAVEAAAGENKASQDEQNRVAWANYLMTRGLNPAGAQTGQIPSNPQAINAKLPLWATANFKRPGATPTWRKKGSGPTAGALTRGGTFAAAPVSPDPYAVASPGASSGPSRTTDFLIGNPAGIGGKNRSFLDPLGIF